MTQQEVSGIFNDSISFSSNWPFSALLAESSHAVPAGRTEAAKSQLALPINQIYYYFHFGHRHPRRVNGVKPRGLNSAADVVVGWRWSHNLWREKEEEGTKSSDKKSIKIHAHNGWWPQELLLVLPRCTESPERGKLN